VEGQYSSMLGARWYNDTHDESAARTSPTYRDKTGTSAIDGCYSLEPFMFTSPVIRMLYRNHADTWRHLGFIPSKHNNCSCTYLKQFSLG
jgi:hypothetical protein